MFAQAVPYYLKHLLFHLYLCAYVSYIFVLKIDRLEKGLSLYRLGIKIIWQPYVADILQMEYRGFNLRFPPNIRRYSHSSVVLAEALIAPVDQLVQLEARGRAASAN